MTEDEKVGWHHRLNGHAAAAAAKSLQSCPTLCDPIDGLLPGSSVHGIFQARVLERGAIAFSTWQGGSLLLSHQGSMDISHFIHSHVYG